VEPPCSRLTNPGLADGDDPSIERLLTRLLKLCLFSYEPPASIGHELLAGQSLANAVNQVEGLIVGFVVSAGYHTFVGRMITEISAAPQYPRIRRAFKL
jgi:hypothetical protein